MISMKIDNKPIVIAALAVLLALTACQKRPRSPIASACDELGSYTYKAISPAISSRCTCLDDAAQRYLDADNYAALERAANMVIIHNRLKYAQSVQTSRGRGSVRTVLDAVVTTADFLMLAHKVSERCI